LGKVACPPLTPHPHPEGESCLWILGNLEGESCLTKNPKIWQLSPSPPPLTPKGRGRGG